MTDYVVTFRPHKRGTDTKTACLYCYVQWESCRHSFALALGYTVDLDKWDYLEQCCVPKSKHGRNRLSGQLINSTIRTWRDRISGVFAGYDAAPTVEQARGDVKKALGIGEKVGVLVAYDRFVLERSKQNGWSEGTMKKFRTLRSRLEQYDGFRDFSCFTEDHLNAYVEHLRDEGLIDSTVFKQLGYLRWFLKWSEQKGLLTCPDYKDYRPKLRAPSSPVVFLEWSELMRVWDWQPDTEFDGWIRDMFCFSCFTSLRWSDVQALRWDDMTDTSLHVVTVKTADPLTIELNKWSSEIVERYVDVSVPGGFVFPRATNQAANRALKEIMKQCGLTTRVPLVAFRGAERIETVKQKYELVCTHTGRRTFICNALMMGIPATTVMQWTGHSDYDSMRPYIAVADTAKAREMKRFDEPKK